MSYHVMATRGAIHGVVTAHERHRCDGHLAGHPHHIEPGERSDVGPLCHPDDLDLPDCYVTTWIDDGSAEMEWSEP